jgi:photosystem II stability/assembly factor-like uncharacterized protein
MRKLIAKPLLGILALLSLGLCEESGNHVPIDMKCSDSTKAIFDLSNAKWAQTNCPIGGNRITGLAVREKEIFAATEAGVLSSSDNGNNWRSLDSGLETTYSILSIAALGKNLFAAAGEDGVFRSTNNGAYWTPANSGLEKVTIHGLAICKEVLFAATSAGIAAYNERDKTWKFVQKWIDVSSIASADSAIFAAAVSGIWRSFDSGRTFSLSNSAPSDVHIQSLSIIGKSIYAFGSQENILRSTDNGNSWSMVYKCKTLEYNAAVASGSSIFATAGYCIIQSTDNGAHWSQTGSLPGGSAYCSALASIGTNLIAGGVQGLYRSSDMGAIWTASRRLPFNHGIRCLATSGNDLFAGAVEGMYRSSDSGRTWSKINKGLYWVQAIAAGSDKNLFVATRNALYHSANNGQYWQCIHDYVSYPFALAAIGKRIFVGRGGEDAGAYWYPNKGETDEEGNSVTEPTTILTTKSWVTALLTIGSRLYIGTSGGEYWAPDGYINGTVFRVNTSTSRNIDLKPGLPDGISITALAANACFVFAGTDSAGIYRRAQSEGAWAAINSGLTGKNIDRLATYRTIVFAGIDNGVFFSANNGDTWAAINAGLPAHVAITALEVCDTNLFAGTSHGGVWRLPISPLSK